MRIFVSPFGKFKRFFFGALSVYLSWHCPSLKTLLGHDAPVQHILLDVGLDEDEDDEHEEDHKMLSTMRMMMKKMKMIIIFAILAKGVCSNKVGHLFQSPGA